MTNDTEVIGTSLIEFGQSGEYHSESMTSAKQAAGFAPLETLPAEWYNNYMALLDQHINKLQNIVLQVQSELVNVLNWDNEASPSATQLNQVLNGITRKINALRPVIATGTTPGLVVSTAAEEGVSVDSTGVMTYNGHAALVSDISTKLEELETEIQDAIDTLNSTIKTRSHVIALNVEDNGSTSTALILKASSRVDGDELSYYTPAAGDMVVLVVPDTVKELEDRVSLTLSIGDSQLTYTDSDGIQLGNSNVFTVVTFASSSGTMVMTSGSGGGQKALRYAKNLTFADEGEEEDFGGWYYTFQNYTPQPGDILKFFGKIYFGQVSWIYGKDGWLPLGGTNTLASVYPDISPASSPYSITARRLKVGAYNGNPYIGANQEEGMQPYYINHYLLLLSSKPIAVNAIVDVTGVNNHNPSAYLDCVTYSMLIYKVSAAMRLNNVVSSNTNLCYADGAGNLHAHTLELS